MGGSYEINHFCFADDRALSLAQHDRANASDFLSTNDPGKAIFSGRCGKCHDADASKKLPDGTTLLARLAKNKDPETRLATRLKNEQERHQVFLYLAPLIEQTRAAAKQQKAP